MSKFKNLHIAGIFLNALLSLFDSVSSETIITLSDLFFSAYNKSFASADSKNASFLFSNSTVESLFLAEPLMKLCSSVPPQ